MSVLESALQKLSDVEIKKGDANFSEYTELVLEKIREMNDKKTRGRVAKAKDADPDRVKRPSPASWMFRDENRAKIIAEHFDGQKTKGSEVAKKAKEVWDEMSEEDRKPWTDRHAEMWAAYKTANPGSGAKSSTPSSPFNVESASEIENPDGWNGPHEGKYLHKMAAGSARGVGKFQTFADALEAANALDTCGGITYDKKLGYQLRVGTDPITHSDGDVVSWTKENHVIKSPEKKARGGGKKKVSGPTEEELAKVQTEIFGADTDNDEDSGGNASENVVVPGGDDSDSDEDEDSDEDSDDGEGSEVVTWKYKGTTYLLDEKTNEVYDMDSQMLIGMKSDKGKLKLNKK